MKDPLEILLYDATEWLAIFIYGYFAGKHKTPIEEACKELPEFIAQVRKILRSEINVPQQDSKEPSRAMTGGNRPPELGSSTSKEGEA